jgi:hypothetical protein
VLQNVAEAVWCYNMYCSYYCSKTNDPEPTLVMAMRRFWVVIFFFFLKYIVIFLIFASVSVIRDLFYFYGLINHFY